MNDMQTIIMVLDCRGLWVQQSLLGPMSVSGELLKNETNKGKGAKLLL